VKVAEVVPVVEREGEMVEQTVKVRETLLEGVRVMGETVNKGVLVVMRGGEPEVD